MKNIMLTLHTKITQADTIDGELVLPFDLREKSRQRATLTCGEEVALFTVRGTVLRDGDLLRGDDGRIVRIVAAQEPTYRVDCATPKALLRCAFHLGNRHTQAQVDSDGERGFLRIRQDSVLKDMLQGLGATVTEENAAFEPESGAYQGGGHGHAHHSGHPLAPIALRQRIHRPSDRQADTPSGQAAPDQG
ncbi:MAG: urease accessory protein [Janthinobacterium sp.]